MLRSSFFKLLIFYVLTTTVITCSMSNRPNDDDDTDYSQLPIDFEIIENTPVNVKPDPKLPCHALTKKYIIIPTEKDIESTSEMNKKDLITLLLAQFHDNKLSVTTKNNMSVEDLLHSQRNGHEIVLESSIRMNDNFAAFRTIGYYHFDENNPILHRTRIDKVYDTSVEGTIYNSGNPSQVNFSITTKINADGQIESF